MSDVAFPDWWQGADDKWYPPHAQPVDGLTVSVVVEETPMSGLWQVIRTVLTLSRIPDTEARYFVVVVDEKGVERVRREVKRLVIAQRLRDSWRVEIAEVGAGRFIFKHGSRVNVLSEGQMPLEDADSVGRPDFLRRAWRWTWHVDRPDPASSQERDADPPT